MSYNPQNPNGQATSANSAPVVVASDQSSLTVADTNSSGLTSSSAGGYVRQDSTATIAKESGGNLATVVTNTNPLAAASAGGYVRQDSNATIAKESGGNLASVATNTSNTATNTSSTATNTSNTATNTNPLTVSSAGGYVRQDSTATIAKESGGNLATVAGAISSSKMNVVANPVTSGGLSVASSAIKATATSVKSSAGQVYGWFVANNNTAMSYLQFFNTASGSVTVGTTTPLFSIGIPANAGANVSFPIGIPFGTAITVAATTTFTGSGAPTNNVEYNIFYN